MANTSVVGVKSVLERILDLDSSKGDIAYAQTYAQAALDLGDSEVSSFEDVGFGIVAHREPTGKLMHGKEMACQLLYVLSNLSAWKGEEARESKKLLTAAAKAFRS